MTNRESQKVKKVKVDFVNHWALMLGAQDGMLGGPSEINSRPNRM